MYTKFNYIARLCASGRWIDGRINKSIETNKNKTHKLSIQDCVLPAMLSTLTFSLLIFVIDFNHTRPIYRGRDRQALRSKSKSVCGLVCNSCPLIYIIIYYDFVPFLPNMVYMLVWFRRDFAFDPRTTTWFLWMRICSIRTWAPIPTKTNRINLMIHFKCVYYLTLV